MGVIIYNGVSSEEFAIQVEHPPGYETPEKDYEITHIGLWAGAGHYSGSLF